MLGNPNGISIARIYRQHPGMWRSVDQLRLLAATAAAAAAEIRCRLVAQAEATYKFGFSVLN
jgi:hypothetical protein